MSASLIETADTNGAAAPEHPRFEFLDGIRGWASVIVMLNHILGGVVILAAPKYLHNNFWRVPTDGNFAVLVFFVLSGYALTISQITTGQKRIMQAAVARYFRLMIPILVSTLIAYLLIKMGLYYNLKAPESPEASHWLARFYKFDPALSGALKFAFYGVFFDYHDETTYNSSLWTMAFELFGSYLVYIHLSVFRRKAHIAWAVIMALAIFFMCHEHMRWIACFYFGYLLAEMRLRYPALPNLWVQILCAALFVGVILIMTYRKPEFDQPQIFLATILVGAVSYSHVLTSFFSCGLSRFLGRISFPLYLIQVVVICSWTSYGYITLPTLGYGPYATANILFASSALLCFLLAVILLPVETYSILWSKALAKKMLSYPFMSGELSLSESPASQTDHI